MKKIYFIANLVAGKCIINDKLGEIIDAFIKKGYEVTVRITQSSGDAVNQAEYACKNNFDMLLCAGGDGTLSQCLQGLMQSENKIPIAYIPAGSTNDFAKCLGIPSDTSDALRWILNGVPTRCDIGALNQRFFTYIAAFGAFTNVTYETSQQIKNILGHSAYLLNGLMQITSLRSQRMRIEYNGTSIEDDFIFGMVTNSASVAGLLSMNDFLLDDGVLEVTLIKKPANIVQLRKIVLSLINISEEINKEYVKFFRTDKITFTSLDGQPIAWTTDGEFGGEAIENTVACHNKAVEFIVNENSGSYFVENSIELPD